MSEENKYAELDKAISKKIMKEFKGKIIDHECPSCGGIGILRTGEDCENCNGKGSFSIEY